MSLDRAARANIDKFYLVCVAGGVKGAAPPSFNQPIPLPVRTTLPKIPLTSL